MRIQRTSQPQIPVAIDRSHPASQGLTLLVNPAAGFTNLVNGFNPLLDTAAHITRGTNAKGKAMVSDGAQNAELSQYGTPGTAGAAAVTACVQLKLDALGGKPIAVWGTVASWLIEIQSDGDILCAVLPSGGIGIEQTSDQPLTTGKVYTIVMRWGDGLPIRCWLDGRELSFGSTARTGTLPTGGFQTLCNSHAESERLDGSISFAAVSKYAWPPEVCRSMSANPWQIFAPREYTALDAPASSSDIAAAGSVSITGAASLNATGNVLAAGALSITGAADLDASGSLVAAGALSISGSADLDASGSLLAAGSISISGAADLDAIGSLIAAGAISISGAAELTGVGGNDIAAAGSLSITGAASLTAIGQLVAAGSIVITGSAQLDDGVVEPEPEATQQPAGSRKRRRRKYLVEIDGKDFEVSSPDEAIALLSRAKAIVKEAVQNAQATRIRPGIQRPVIRTNAPEIKSVVQQARVEITSLYDSAMRDFEIAALINSKLEAEEEEAIIRLLM